MPHFFPRLWEFFVCPPFPRPLPFGPPTVNADVESICGVLEGVFWAGFFRLFSGDTFVGVAVVLRPWVFSFPFCEVFLSGCSLCFVDACGISVSWWGGAAGGWFCESSSAQRAASHSAMLTESGFRQQLFLRVFLLDDSFCHDVGP